MISGDVATAITHTKSQYFFGLDTKQWDVVRATFTDDAQFEGFPFATNTPDLFTDQVGKFLEGAQTIHQGFMPAFEQISDSVVKVRWTMFDYLIWHDSREYKGHLIPGQYGLRGYGYYEERYRAVHYGHWLIEFMRLTRTRIDPLVATPVPSPQYDVLAPTANWLEEPQA